MSNRNILIVAGTLSTLILIGAGCGKPAPSAPQAPAQAPAVGAPVVGAPVDQESACAGFAKVIFDRQGFTPDNKASFVSHYNAKLGKCFLEVQNSAYAADIKRNQVIKSLFDADGAVYGTFSAVEGTTNPLACLMQEKTCTTEVEFDAYVNTYLEK